MKKLLLSGRVAVSGQKWLYSCNMVVNGQNVSFFPSKMV